MTLASFLAPLLFLVSVPVWLYSRRDILFGPVVGALKEKNPARIAPILCDIYFIDLALEEPVLRSRA